MNRAIAWAARNPVAANLFMFGVILAGILGYFRMEREVFPTIRINQVDILVAWPGAAPQEPPRAPSRARQVRSGNAGRGVADE